MSRPKLLRILQSVADRLPVVSQAAGYYTDIGQDVRLDRQPPADAELPCVLVFLGERVREGNTDARAKAQQSLTVAGFVPIDGRGSEVQAAELLADIQRAVETEDSTLGGLLLASQYGLTWAGDEVLTPDVGENVVGAQVVYAIPHIRKSGDPEITA